jgi:hypothetical protein
VKIKQFKNLPSFKAPSKINNVTKAIAITSLAMGVAAMIPAAPVGAVTLIPGQQLNFKGETTDFYPAASTGANFSVNFFGDGTSRIVGAPATTQLGGIFPAGSSVALTSQPVGDFSYVSGSGTNLVYRLANDLTFNFGNIVGTGTPTNTSYTVTRGALFSTIYNDGNQGVQFSTTSDAAFFTNNGTVTPALTSLFQFGDVPLVVAGNSAGSYQIIGSPNAPTAVPEPFTVIGTLVGGAAALRMRKKFADATKN